MKKSVILKSLKTVIRNEGVVHAIVHAMIVQLARSFTQNVFLNFKKSVRC